MLVVADDLGYNDVGFQDPSYSLVRTPRLTALAKEGVRFTNHHVQPFCSPTRACLMTGRHVLRYGLQNTVIWPQDAWALPLNETFLSENLRAAGYHTAVHGKWHLGFYRDEHLPMARGFDEQYGYYTGEVDYWDHSRDGGLDWHRNGTVERGDSGRYSADLIGAATVDYIRRRGAAAPGQPWFLYLPFQSVHSPMQAPQRYLDMYPHLEGNVRTRAAMVSALDANFWDVVDALVSTGQMQKTIIVFTSDNGAPYTEAFDAGDDPAMIDALRYGPGSPPRPPNGTHGSGGGSNYPLSGWKHYVFEGGVRAASFVYSSDLAHPGSQHHGLFHAVDWLPTLAGRAGASTAANLPLDGFDIWGAIQAGGRASPRTEVPVEIAACGGDFGGQTIVDGPQAAMIVGDLKVIVQCWWRGTKLGGTAQLYNITADAGERRDLAADRPGDVARLLGRLDWWERQSVPPYRPDPACGAGKPLNGSAYPYWGPWCCVV